MKADALAVAVAGSVLAAAAGWAALSAPAAGREEPSSDRAAAAPMDVSEARRAERAVQLTVLAYPRDLSMLAAARRRTREALAAAEKAAPADETLVLSLKSMRVDLEARWQEALREAWFDYRRAKGLRDWGAARGSLRRIRDAIADPYDPDFRKARALLAKLSTR